MYESHALLKVLGWHPNNVECEKQKLLEIVKVMRNVKPVF